MESADLVKVLCKSLNISINELARRLDQSPQNLVQKMKRGTLRTRDMRAIAESLGVSYEHRFVVPVSNLGNDNLSEEISVGEDNKIYVRSDAEMLIAAISSVYPFFLAVNLSRNTYRVMGGSYWGANITKESGTFDDVVNETIETLPALKWRQRFKQTFSRRALINSYKSGIRKVQLEYQQMFNDGQIHWTETVAIFVPDYGGDIKAITFCRNIDQEMKKEEEFRIIGNIPGGAHICYLGNPIHLEYINISMSRLLGYGYQELKTLLGKQYSKLIIEEDRESFRKFVTRLSKKEMTDSCIYRMIKKDGEIIYVLDTMQSTKGLDGIMRGYSIVTDVTEQVEESIRKEKHYNGLEQQLLHFQTALLDSSYGYLLVDLSRNEIIGDVNTFKHGRKKNTEAMGCIPTDFHEFVNCWANKYLVSNKEDFIKQNNCEFLIDRYNNGHSSFSIYCIVRGEDDEIHHLHQRYYLSKEDESVVAFCLLSDITEDIKKNKELQELLKENDELTRISEVLTTLYGTVYVVEADTAAYRVYTKTETEKFNFVEKGENFYDRAFEIIDKDIIEKDQSMIRKIITDMQKNEILKGTTNLSTVYHRRMTNGELQFYSIKLLKLKHNGKNLYLLLNKCIDDSLRRRLLQEEEQRQTERKYYEELKALKDKVEELSNAKTEFLFNMSHELRTPLTAVLGFAELAKKSISDNQTATENIEQIEKSGKILLSMLNEVFDIVKIEREIEIAAEEEEFDIRALCEDLISIVTADNKDKEINIEYDAVSVYNTVVVADKTRIIRVLLNIFDNAMKYTKDNGHIVLSVKETDSEKVDCRKYVFICEDDGTGIRKDVLSKIYDPFIRESTSTKSGIKGIGLGLTLTKKLIETLGGEIKIESIPDKGTKVRVSVDLKVKDAIKNIDEKIVDRKRWQEGLLQGKKFLIVEDNDLNSMIEEYFISGWGATSKTVKDGELAVAELKKGNEYDAVLMDIQMPNMDGFEATRCIRGFSNKKIANIPIIAVSANTFSDDVKNAKEAGMNSFVPKPIDSYQLYEAIGDNIC